MKMILTKMTNVTVLTFLKNQIKKNNKLEKTFLPTNKVFKIHSARDPAELNAFYLKGSDSEDEDNNRREVDDDEDDEDQWEKDQIRKGVGITQVGKDSIILNKI